MAVGVYPASSRSNVWKRDHATPLSGTQNANNFVGRRGGFGVLRGTAENVMLLFRASASGLCPRVKGRRACGTVEVEN